MVLLSNNIFNESSKWFHTLQRVIQRYTKYLHETPLLFSSLAIQMAAAVAVNVGQDRLSKITRTTSPRLIRRLLAVTGAIGKFIHQAYEPSRLRVGYRIPLRQSLCVQVYGRGLVCIRNDSRAPSPREFIDSRATASFGRCSVLSSLLPLFWLTVAPVSCLRGLLREIQ